jgi:WD40 repeat protein
MLTVTLIDEGQSLNCNRLLATIIMCKNSRRVRSKAESSPLLQMKTRTLVLIAMLVGSAHAQFVGDSEDHSAAQQGGSIASAESSDGDQKEYESWIRPYRQAPPQSVDGVDPSGHGIVTPALLGIIVEKGDDIPINEKRARLSGNGYRIVTYGCTVSADGRISYFDGRFNGFGGFNLPKKDLLELMRLLHQLPDDHSRLPPPGRRLVIQAAAAGGVGVRVYDRANPPDPVLEIIRLVRVRFALWSIDFPPEKTGSPAEFSQAGIEVRWPRATSPDGSLEATQGAYEIVISSSTKGDFRWLREPEVNRHVDALFGPFFSLDGRFLLVQSTHPAVHIYDTSTWEQIQTLPGLPPDVVGYFPDKDWKLGVFASSKGDIGLWDSHTRRQIASFASGEELMDAAFSPDHSLVAVAVQRKTEEQTSGLHVRIWRTDGAPVSELEPWNQIMPLGLSGFSKLAGLLAWWSDSEHLLTVVQPDVFYTDHNLALWNAKTGRYEGDLSGCGLSIERFMVSTKDGHVFAECSPWGIYVWDASGAINRITNFEQSLRDPN